MILEMSEVCLHFCLIEHEVEFSARSSCAMTNYLSIGTSDLRNVRSLFTFCLIEHEVESSA